MWSGGPITCKHVDCGDVPGLLNGAVHVLDGRTTYGARIKVTNHRVPNQLRREYNGRLYINIPDLKKIQTLVPPPS